MGAGCKHREGLRPHPAEVAGYAAVLLPHIRYLQTIIEKHCCCVGTSGYLRSTAVGLALVVM